MTIESPAQIKALDAVTPSATRTKVLVMAYDRIGERMAGPGVRSWEIAKSLAPHADVTVASMSPIERTAEGVTTFLFNDEHYLAVLAEQMDVIILQGLTLRRHPRLYDNEAIIVVDLYDPWVLENLELHAPLSDGRCAELLLADSDAQNELIDAGDFFICASERQRDYWLGMLTSRGRVDRASWLSDPELRDLVDVVPYGCPTDPPAATPALKGVHPQVNDDDTIFLWSGGAWEWFDPLLAVDAFADAAEQHPNMVMYFMGLGLAGHTPDMPVAKKLHERAEELSRRGIRILFGDWVPYDERSGFLVEAHAAIIATRPSVESRLAFRSRMLDHFWAGLPTITTPGDILADMIGDRGAGVVYPHSDKAALTAAMLQVHGDRDATARMSASSRDLADEFRWARTTEPLQRVVANPDRWVTQRDTRLAHLKACDITPAWRHSVNGELRARHKHTGFHSRGPVMDAMKMSRMYPFMRRVRRSRFGLWFWGEVPGEQRHAVDINEVAEHAMRLTDDHVTFNRLVDEQGADRHVIDEDKGSAHRRQRDK